MSRSRDRGTKEKSDDFVALSAQSAERALGVRIREKRKERGAEGRNIHRDHYLSGGSQFWLTLRAAKSIRVD